MSTVEYRFIEPLDALFLRGNKLFGDPGSYGECLIPPWPSVAAGAIRSRMLVDRKIDFAKFAQSKESNDKELGTPENPGSFTLTSFNLARRTNSGVEILVSPPADLVITKSATSCEDQNHLSLEVRCLRPQTIDIPSSFPLPLLPVLTQEKRIKAESGYWLTQAGWSSYINGITPSTEHLVHSSKLWSFDARVGIGMSAETRSVEEGKLFSTQALVLYKRGDRINIERGSGTIQICDYDVGFLAGISGATPPNGGLLRFGGDGRGASIAVANFHSPEPDYQAIAQTGRCRLILTTPGLFPNGWNLPGTDNGNRVVLPGGITARLASAAVPRFEIISGWDLAAQHPKPAQRVAPTGSVYWLDELQATPEALRKLVENGLWQDPCEDKIRRAEGFNRVAIAAWATPSQSN